MVPVNKLSGFLFPIVYMILNIIYLLTINYNNDSPAIMITGAYNAFREDGSLINDRFEQNIIKLLHSLVKLGKQLKSNPE